jgi:hypothetical protein
VARHAGPIRRLVEQRREILQRPAAARMAASSGRCSW